MKHTSLYRQSMVLMGMAVAAVLVACQSDKYKAGDPVTSAEELTQALELVSDGATITLAPNAEITLGGELAISKSVEIAGDETAPAHITLGKGGLVLSGSLGLANVVIDAGASKEPFIGLSEQVSAEELNGTDYYAIDHISLVNCRLNGVKSNLIYDNDTKYCVVSLSIDNCVIELNTQRVDNEAIIGFKAGGVKDFSIRNSTVYGNSPEVMYFIRYNNSARLDRYGFDTMGDYQSMVYENNTFFDVIKDDGQWGNYNGIGGQDFSRYVIKGNIWKNCGKEIIRRLSGGRFGQNALIEIADNTYWGADGQMDESKYDTSGTALTTDPAFRNAPTDFAPTGAEQVERHTGDPRWYN